MRSEVTLFNARHVIKIRFLKDGWTEGLELLGELPSL